MLPVLATQQPYFWKGGGDYEVASISAVCNTDNDRPGDRLGLQQPTGCATHGYTGTDEYAHPADHHIDADDRAYPNADPDPGDLLHGRVRPGSGLTLASGSAR